MTRGDKLLLEARRGYADGRMMLSVYGKVDDTPVGHWHRSYLRRVLLQRVFVDRTTPKEDSIEMLTAMCAAVSITRGVGYVLRAKIQ